MVFFKLKGKDTLFLKSQKLILRATGLKPLNNP
jgi:hypothetical protein